MRGKSQGGGICRKMSSLFSSFSGVVLRSDIYVSPLSHGRVSVDCLFIACILSPIRVTREHGECVDELFILTPILGKFQVPSIGGCELLKSVRMHILFVFPPLFLLRKPPPMFPQLEGKSAALQQSQHPETRVVTEGD